MANLADEYGTDVEFYVKALTTTIHADTRTGAPAALHDLLEQLGLKHHEYPAGAPLYIWHTVPDDLAADEKKRLASRALPALHLAGYKVNCSPDVFDEAAFQQAAHEARAHTAPPLATQPGTGPLLLAPRTSPAHLVRPFVRPRLGPGPHAPLDSRRNP
ncbi:hypothetical protein [Streptomyces fradiae]|uniref:hypothetical protein n=1 Tax=Streptomyces fradiae TaxID=1906 RepID=UPI0039856F90